MEGGHGRLQGSVVEGFVLAIVVSRKASRDLVLGARVAWLGVAGEVRSACTAGGVDVVPLRVGCGTWITTAKNVCACCVRCEGVRVGGKAPAVACRTSA